MESRGKHFKNIREKYNGYYEKQIAICEAHGGDRRRVEVRILHCFFYFLFTKEMEKMGFLQSSIIFLKKNASIILTCVGGAGVIATSVTAVKATPKELALLENEKEEKGE